MGNDDFGLGDLFTSAAQPPTPAEPVQTPSKTQVAAKQKQRMRKIIIDEVEGETNSEVVGVNGVFYQIQRGVEVEVPESVVEVLRNAIGTRWVQTQRADGRVDLVPRSYSTIPWRLVD